jgi:hypothetical protein
MKRNIDDIKITDSQGNTYGVSAFAHTIIKITRREAIKILNDIAKHGDINQPKIFINGNNFYMESY